MIDKNFCQGEIHEVIITPDTHDRWSRHVRYDEDMPLLDMAFDRDVFIGRRQVSLFWSAGDEPVSTRDMLTFIETCKFQAGSVVTATRFVEKHLELIGEKRLTCLGSVVKPENGEDGGIGFRVPIFHTGLFQAVILTTDIVKGGWPPRSTLFFGERLLEA